MGEEFRDMTAPIHLGCMPVIIIGAPRSGTNMLRDVLTRLPGVSTWPCDEINYIWRHGNIGFPSDEFKPEMARLGVSRYIRQCFERLANKNRSRFIVEKTCANSLRVEFIQQVLPEAFYIYIVRDGLDAVASAKKRWQAKLDLPYLARKARYVPFSDLPYYGFRYLGNRLYRLYSREKRLAFWGPTFNGLDEILTKHTLDEVCALQWQRCVNRADEAFANIEPGRICRVSYETFVSNPGQELQRIAGFVGIELDGSTVKNLVYEVSAKNVGKGRKELGQEMVAHLEKLIGATLSRHGYIR